MRGKREAAEARGRWAEVAAQLVLTLKGYRILATRVRTAQGEVDIVARRGNVVVFVEVKARATFTAAVEAITPRQRQRIAAAATAFMARRPGLQNCGVRFDVVLLAPRQWPRHIIDAWRP
jgi:putative endonuclease